MTTPVPPIPEMSKTEFTFMKLGEVIAVAVKALEGTANSLDQMAELARVVVEEDALDRSIALKFFNHIQDTSANTNQLLDHLRNLTTPLLTILEIDPDNLSTLSKD